MNQTISFQRWISLVAKHWAENRKRYLLSIAAYMGLLFVWFVFIMMTDKKDPLAKGLQQVSFYFSFILIGPFYASQFFKELSSKSKGTNFLMVPASTVEKLICSVFYVIIFFPIILTAAFYLIDALAVFIANASHPSYNGPVDANGNLLSAKLANVFNPGNQNDRRMLFYGTLLFLAVQSAALLGSVYFGQYSYIKTAITLTLLFLFFALVMNYFIDSFMPRGFFRENMTQFIIYEGEENKMIQLPHWIGKTIEFLMFYAFPPIFWISTYFRLKEKEI
jgi:hypothetical protein